MKLKMLYAFALAVCSCVAAPAASAAGSGYPEAGRPISVVVPFGAGSGTDVITRIILSGMSKDLGGNFVVLNKAGASGQIGTEFVARAQPDGYTLLVATNSFRESVFVQVVAVRRRQGLRSHRAYDDQSAGVPGQGRFAVQDRG